MNRNFVQKQQISKLRLRKEMIARRQSLKKEFVVRASEKIRQKVVALAVLSDAQNIGAYLPIANEVNTRLIIEHLVSVSKQVFLPRFDSQTSKYSFEKFVDWEEIELGPYGILQPSLDIISKEPSYSTFEVRLDVAIVPGVTFDKRGVRLGYGKGVFDRLLADSPAYKIGLAFDFQIVDELPKEKHDLVMDLVVTESVIHRPILI